MSRYHNNFDFQRKICENEEKGLMVNTESYCSSLPASPLRIVIHFASQRSASKDRRIEDTNPLQLARGESRHAILSFISVMHIQSILAQFNRFPNPNSVHADSAHQLEYAAPP
ncbi:hypothetical protein C8J56DRAFT_897881 [Mycena floridula]|nr:hypothetical protein C8J56DRAFT_897881 [Mycena floridula]